MGEAAAAALGGGVEQISAVLEVLSADSPLGLGPLTEGIEQWPEPDRESALTELRALSAVLIQPLVAVASHRQPSLRVGAVQLLSRFEDERATAAIVQGLSDESPLVQRGALKVLGDRQRQGSGDAMPLVVDLLSTARGWSTRMEAARALGRLQDHGAVEALATALSQDPYAFVREAAALALRNLPGERARMVLQEAGRTDPEPRVREAAHQALSSFQPRD